MKTILASLTVVIIFCLTARNASAAQEKEWTMLVFINGHNNLDSFGSYNLNQMEQVGSTPWLNVVAQWASLKNKKTKRLLVTKDDQPDRVTSPIVEELEPVDMGDKGQLLEFIRWGAEHYPAKHYFVEVWDHGAGWHLNRAGFQTRDISWDDKTGHYITTEQLGEVMKDAAKMLGHPVDIYGSDACLMAMAEVGAEMVPAVNVMVGSEELEPGEGWPYDTFLREWVAKPNATSLEIGAFLTKTYGEKYNDSGDMNTFSTLDLTKMSALQTSLNALKGKILSYPEIDKVTAAAAQSVRFFYDDYVDLGSLMDNLTLTLQRAGMDKELSDVQARIQDIVTANSTNTMAKGIAVWWPTDADTWKSYRQRYRGLVFDQATGWSQLFEKIFQSKAKILSAVQ